MTVNAPIGTNQFNQKSPLSKYHHLLGTKQILTDPNQLAAITELDKLYSFLQQQKRFSKVQNQGKSLFLWGPVGVGKTFLMDLFYQSLPSDKKLRLHFNRFMARIHDDLNRQSGHANPLKRVAKNFFKEVKVLCLDELFITDIGDGMILYHLLESLFSHGLILVTTSNFPINALYKDDLQPRIFDPAVLLLETQTKQLHLQGELDYRLNQKNPRQTFFSIDQENFIELFQQLSHGQVINSQALTIANRPITVRKSSSTIAWFDFNDLCCGPRSQLDYIELANRYQCILLSNIPIMGGKPKNQIIAKGTEDSSNHINATGERKVFYALEDNAARRFISLIDVFYDKGTHLYLSASAPLEDLYCGETLCFEFKRTHSRLIEMQSDEYLA